MLLGGRMCRSQSSRQKSKTFSMASLLAWLRKLISIVQSAVGSNSALIAIYTGIVNGLDRLKQFFVTSLRGGLTRAANTIRFETSVQLPGVTQSTAQVTFPLKSVIRLQGARSTTVRLKGARSTTVKLGEVD